MMKGEKHSYSHTLLLGFFGKVICPPMPVSVTVYQVIFTVLKAALEVIGLVLTEALMEQQGLDFILSRIFLYNIE